MHKKLDGDKKKRIKIINSTLNKEKNTTVFRIERTREREKNRSKVNVVLHNAFEVCLQRKKKRNHKSVTKTIFRWFISTLFCSSIDCTV